MKEYGDEAFIYELVRREAVPKYEGNDIRNGFADVGENSISFCERCIVENRLYITIPAEFKPMPSWMVKKYHPYKNRPDIIFSENEKVLKSVNFWLEDNPSENTEMETVLEKILEKVNPKHKIVNTILVCNFFELDEAGVEGIRVGRFELVTINEDKEISDLIFFFPLDGQYIIGSFKAISVDLPKWMDVIMQMLFTIRIT